VNPGDQRKPSFSALLSFTKKHVLRKKRIFKKNRLAGEAGGLGSSSSFLPSKTAIIEAISFSKNRLFLTAPTLEA